MLALIRLPLVRRLLVLVLVLGAISVSLAAPRKVRMPRPGRGAQIVVGPMQVPQGAEATGCTYLKMPGKKDLAVNKVKIKVQGGSHHIHLYRPYDKTASFDDHFEACDFALDFDVWQLILASQTPFLHWRLPKGVAFHFKAGEQLLAQTHYVDNGLLESPDEGWANFNLYSIPEKKVTSYAGSFFGQDRDVVVPPMSSGATATMRCLFPKPVKLLAITGHYHFRGVKFVASEWDGVNDGPPIYEYQGYDEPIFTQYNSMEVKGLSWTCSYENPTDTNFTFGPFTDRNEHCNMFAFYYPAVGKQEFMTCVQKDGVATVEVTN